MPERELAGSRIRQRRLAQGLKQTELAEAVGISASYLNLIEHNRRRIGGKLMARLAVRLEVDQALLADGAARAVVVRLGNITERFGEVLEASEAAEFAGRFPDWANLMIRAVRRVEELERHVEALTDRLAHDPHLAASLHEVLSTVTALRSTATILNDEREIEPEWLARFHRNMSEDATRLAEGAQALVAYMDASGDAQSEAGSPQEELMHALEARQWYFEELERGEESVREAGPASESGQALFRAHLSQYAADVAAWPEGARDEALEAVGLDPLALSLHASLPLDVVFRRLAAKPELGLGLVSCDASGTILLRKPVAGFKPPRFGAACPLWPLFTAFSRPMVPLKERLALPDQSGQDAHYESYAVAQPMPVERYDTAPVLRATMLILPSAERSLDARAVGMSCRICPRAACAARREISIMARPARDAFDRA